MNKTNIILIIILIFFYIYLLCYLKKTPKYNNPSKGRCKYFQHNSNYMITIESYKYIEAYKKELLKNVTKLMNDLNIKFSISDGLLLQYTRGKPILEDDDIDIRFDKNDFKKWEDFCNKNNKKLDKYNLIFDDRFTNIKQQKINGIQCSLINFNGNSKYKNINILVDLVSSNVENKFWADFNINFNNLRKVKIYNVETFIPSKEDATEYLKFTYGPNYIIPLCSYKPK